MNQEAYESGLMFYQSGKWNEALSLLDRAKEPGEISGEIDHVRGNIYMQLQAFDDAAAAYEAALKDTAYGKRGALLCNQGRALVAGGHVQDAVSVLKEAATDPSYATPYKAYLALGDALNSLDDTRSAAVAYRNAALDETNPEPLSALLKLAQSFLRLRRPLDAVETYRTALNFAVDGYAKGEVLAGMGVAYMAANRVAESVDAFENAVTDTGYTLNAQEEASYTAVKNALQVTAQKRAVSDTDAFLAEAGFSGGFDPLDPAGESGEIMPSPEDTGFFSVTEAELISADKQRRKMHRKKHHTGIKVFLVIVFLLVLIEAALALLYINGYGWPTQAQVAEELFDLKTEGSDISQVFYEGVSSAKIEEINDWLPAGAKLVSSGTDQSMITSSVFVTMKLSEGGTQDFLLEMYRDGISWKVVDVSVERLAE